MLREKRIAEIVRSHANSGLSVEEYCRKVGIRPNRFYYWRKALLEKAKERFIEVRAGGAMAELGINGRITVKLPVSEVPGLLRSLELAQTPCRLDNAGGSKM